MSQEANEYKPLTNQSQRSEALISAVSKCAEIEGFNLDDVVIDPTKPLTVRDIIRQTIVSRAMFDAYEMVAREILNVNRQELWDWFTKTELEKDDDIPDGAESGQTLIQAAVAVFILVLAFILIVRYL